MKIVIIGPGSMGLLIASKLALAGNEPLLLDYRQERAERLNQTGIIYQNRQDKQICRPKFISQPRNLTNIDALIFCVKSYSLSQSLQFCQPLLERCSLALFMQNGISHLQPRRPDHVSAAFASTTEGAYLVEPGHIYHAGQGITKIGFLANAPEKSQRLLKELITELNSSGLKSEESKTIEEVVWSKLLVNIGINGLTAIYNCTNGELLKRPEAQARMKRAVTEAEEVARAIGIKLPPDPLEQVRAVCRATENNISSMLQDIRAGRSTEIRAINVALLEIATQHGIACPENALIVSEVLRKEALRLEL
ncbi:ketopantoate reductase family protein [Desulfotalea psychrophila]|uniref:2-dehydropantoate 2-reductase n=1 Tax=Desulfotalea psychrophila (strain LSv54 / DSM 12343) TaxID=177439 RepID=Q6AS75_DESPS|nr:2-dehydropantoate 2-reductase [Desulfotalea psychrophila]CAG34800.1 related to 2-dehydropantoate 2-reductase [Desulfotalea psychrophila LSv54]